MFSEGGSKEYLKLRTLVRSSDYYIIPRRAETNGGIDIGGERLKSRFKTIFII